MTKRGKASSSGLMRCFRRRQALAVTFTAGFLYVFVANLPYVFADTPPVLLQLPPSPITANSASKLRGLNTHAMPSPVSVAPPGDHSDKPALAKGLFLIASRELKDPNFAQTVVLLVEYDPGGAMGLVINRPTNLALSMVLPAMEELEDRTDTVFIGGPVGQDRLVLLIRAGERPDESEHVFENIYISGSRTALAQMIKKVEPHENFHAYIGYAGWAPGQLEGEVARGDWILASANGHTVFDSESSEVWPELIRQNSGLWVKPDADAQRWQMVARVCLKAGPGC